MVDEEKTLTKEQCGEYFLRRDGGKGNQLVSYIEVKPKVRFYGYGDCLGRKTDLSELAQLNETYFSRIEIIANLPTADTCGSLRMNASDPVKVHSYLFGRKYTSEKKLRTKFVKLNKRIRKDSERGAIIFRWKIHERLIKPQD